jgi:hypothetical protein
LGEKGLLAQQTVSKLESHPLLVFVTPSPYKTLTSVSLVRTEEVYFERKQFSVKRLSQKKRIVEKIKLNTVNNFAQIF